MASLTESKLSKSGTGTGSMAAPRNSMGTREKALFVAQQLHFANTLAGNDPKLRVRAMKKLRKYFLARSSGNFCFTKDDLMRIWKGLFYCMWMSDKPLIQEELAEEISQLIHCFSSNKDDTGLKFIESYFSTMMTEWYGIDYHRMDKFQMFVRRFLRQSLFYCKNKKWSEETVIGLCNVFKCTILDPSCENECADISLIIHFVDIFVEELAKVGTGNLPKNVLLLFLATFAENLTEQTDYRLQSAIRDKVFYCLIRQSPQGMEYEEKFEAWKRAGFPGNSWKDMIFVGKEHDTRSGVDIKYFDPRAGKVNVYLPHLEFDADSVVKLLQKSVEETSEPNCQKFLQKIVRKFQDLTKNEYPLAMSISRELKGMKKYRFSKQIVDDAVEDLISFNKNLEKNSRKIENMCKRKKNDSKQIKQKKAKLDGLSCEKEEESCNKQENSEEIELDKKRTLTKKRCVDSVHMKQKKLNDDNTNRCGLDVKRQTSKKIKRKKLHKSFCWEVSDIPNYERKTSVEDAISKETETNVMSECTETHEMLQCTEANEMSECIEAKEMSECIEANEMSVCFETNETSEYSETNDTSECSETNEKLEYTDENEMPLYIEANGTSVCTEGNKILECAETSNMFECTEGSKMSSCTEADEMKSTEIHKCVDGTEGHESTEVSEKPRCFEVNKMSEVTEIYKRSDSTESCEKSMDKKVNENFNDKTITNSNLKILSHTPVGKILTSTNAGENMPPESAMLDGDMGQVMTSTQSTKIITPLRRSARRRSSMPQPSVEIVTDTISAEVCLTPTKSSVRRRMLKTSQSGEVPEISIEKHDIAENVSGTSNKEIKIACTQNTKKKISNEVDEKEEEISEPAPVTLRSGKKNRTPQSAMKRKLSKVLLRDEQRDEENGTEVELPTEDLVSQESRMVLNPFGIRITRRTNRVPDREIPCTPISDDQFQVPEELARLSESSNDQTPEMQPYTDSSSNKKCEAEEITSTPQKVVTRSSSRTLRAKRFSLRTATPGSAKKITIDLQMNRSQAVSEYVAAVKQSPSVPHDANKKPCKGVLKRTSIQSPINPFYVAPRELK